MKHRFENDHPCVPLEVMVSQALSKARQDMSREGYAEAHATLLKVFGNILKEPTNEKFRSLKKENAVVKQKLNHPACIQALLTCGFEDRGDVYVCRSAVDFNMMRQMQIALQKNQPGQAPQQIGSAPSGQGTRLVNGVIIREAPAPAPAVKAVAKNSQPLAESASVPKSSGGYAAPKHKSARDFESRSKREQQEQAQREALEEARRLQKDRYKTGADAPQAAFKAPVTPATSGSQNQNSTSDCVMQ